MSRLHTELHRLYGLPLSDAPAAGALLTPDAAAGLRLLVLGLARPADWTRLQAVWLAVQDALGLPAPAIVIDGVDGMQLWFALAQPVPTAQAQAFLDGLRRQHLADLPEARVACWPGAPRPAPLRVPGGEVQAEQWSAFVAPDLAPMFAETPWLDLAPPLDGQAELLARLQPAAADVFERACERLADRANRAAEASAVSASGASTAQPAAPRDAAAAGADPAAAAAAGQARQFLLGVMHDAQQPMALRIEAARALLGPAGR